VRASGKLKSSMRVLAIYEGFKSSATQEGCGNSRGF
jgi:hypothetical protein